MIAPETMAAGVLFAGLALYALFGGADFGGGIWTALAWGPRAVVQRKALFHAIGPVWETNHVWLIFMIVTLFTAFPAGFAAISIALMTPLVLALIGINFRGAAFAFRHFGRDTERKVPLGARTFEIASAMTPFTMGMAVTAVAAGRIIVVEGRVEAGLWSWLNPFTVGGGVIGLAVCAYLAPIYMTVRVTGNLREDFRRGGIAAGIALGILTAIQVPVAIWQAPLFAERLLDSWPLAFVTCAAAGGVTTQILLWRRLFLSAQIVAAGTVSFTLAGFAAALFPDLLIGQMSLLAAAAPRPTLIAFLTVLPFGALILVPSLMYLYWTFRGEPDTDLPPADTER